MDKDNIGNENKLESNFNDLLQSFNCIIGEWTVNQSQPKGYFNLYHYTSPSSFFGIMDSKILWFTNYRFFLDASEILYAFSILKNSISNENLNTDFSRGLSEFCDCMDINKIDAIRGFQTRNPPEYYIGSFSTVKDDLFMWNSYTKTQDRSGYCIEFKGNDFIKKGYDAGFEFRMIGLVEYEGNQQIKKIKQLVTQCNDWINANHSVPNVVKHALCGFSHAFYCVAPFMKNPCFKAENEYRIVIESSLISENETNPIIGYENDNYFSSYPLKVKYRESSGIMIPFFAVPIKTECISMVIPSPYMDYSLAKEGLTRFIKSKNNYIPVIKSSIPFRNNNN